MDDTEREGLARARERFAQDAEFRDETDLDNAEIEANRAEIEREQEAELAAESAGGYFHLSIKLGNEAMQTPFDVCGALQLCAERVLTHGFEELTIFDRNGNTVGRYELDPDGTEAA